eukprot:scpid107783/ scgid25176/ 
MRAFTVLKDVLPTHHFSHLVYNFECRHCSTQRSAEAWQAMEAPTHYLCSGSSTNARHTPLPDPQPFDQTLPASIADQTTTITYQRPRRSTANYSMNYDTGKQQRHRARPSVTATLDVTANDEDDDGNRTEGGDSKQ